MTGLATAVRLSVRLNYRGLAAGVLALIVAMYAGTLGIGSLYPTAMERISYASIAATLTSQAALQGPPVGLDTTGGIAVFEVGWYLTIAVALLNIVLVVRNTRAQEAAGRLELLRAGRFGTHANSVAVLGLAAVVNGLLAAGLALAMVLAGAAAGGALAFGVSAGLVGAVFAGFALVAAQLTEHARGAYGAACAVLGAAYVLRALGETVDSDLLRLISPLGLAQAAHPFGALRLWPWSAAALIAVVAAAVALGLENLRDHEAGLIRPAPGSPVASRFTRTVPGLVARTQRAGVAMWAAALFALGAGFGLAASDAGDVAAGTQGMLNLLAGFNVDVVDGFLAMSVLLLSLAASGSVIGHVLALRAEELSGRADLVLSGTLTTVRLAVTHLAVTAAASVLLLLVLGLGIGIGHGVRTGDPNQPVRLIVATMAQAPALVFFGGLTMALVGLAPRFGWLPWAVLAGSAVVSILGPSMDLPGLAMNLSVFHHVPHLPGVAVDGTPPLLLGLLGVLSAGVGTVAFARRDLS